MMERVTVFCFEASYAVALAFEILQLMKARPVLRVLGLSFGAAGLLAHTLFIAVQPLSLAAPQGSLLFLAWILAVFYLYGSLHHRHLVWGLFILPLVLGLIVLGELLPAGSVSEWRLFDVHLLSGDRFWGMIHGCLLLLAAVGVCVGCVASVMYLVQVERLKAKAAPGQGLKMLSLERIEAMNRRAILWAFPLLTAGLLVGIGLQVQHGEFFRGWESPKILSVLGLWIVFAILLYLRYGVHVRGRQAAWWTLLAFVLLLLALVSPVHPFLEGDVR
jgi:ABC-type uncharacterized transport system permease subunit